LSPHINKKTEKKEKNRENTKNQKKYLKKKNINEKNILEHLGNCQKLVEENQNI